MKNNSGWDGSWPYGFYGLKHLDHFKTEILFRNLYIYLLIDPSQTNWYGYLNTDVDTRRLAKANIYTIGVPLDS